MAKAKKKVSKSASKAQTKSKAKGKAAKAPVAKKATAKKATEKKVAAKKPAAKATAKTTAKTTSQKSNQKTSQKIAQKITKTAGKALKAASSMMKSKTPAAVKQAASNSTKDSMKSSKSPKGKGSTAFAPLDDRVLVQRMGAADRTPGGLYIPETVSAADRPTQGTVLAVGNGHRDKKGRVRPLDVKEGDTVMFQNFAGSEIQIDNQDFIVLREEEIIAIVKP